MSEQVAGPAPTVLDWGLVCEVVWQASALARRRLHTAVSGRGCPSRRSPYEANTSVSRPVPGSCERSGCLDFFHDLLLATYQRVERFSAGGHQLLDDPRRYTFVVATRTMADLKRSQRVRMGLPARPGRQDGPAKRVVAALQQQCPKSAGWLADLFRMIRDHAHTLDRSRPDWPLDRWILEKSANDGIRRSVTPHTRREIRTDIAEVLSVARSVLGADWVNTHVLGPLFCTTAMVPIDERAQASPMDLTEMILSQSLRANYLLARSRGESAADAYRTAAAAVVRVVDPPVTPEIRSLLRVLDVELIGSR